MNYTKMSETNSDISSSCLKRSCADAESQRDPGKPWRGKGRRRLFRVGYVFVAYAVGILLITGVRVRNEKAHRDRDLLSGNLDVEFGDSHQLIRHRRDSVSVDTELNLQNSGSSETVNCTPRSVHNFPDNFLSFEQTRDGGVVIHILIALYMFAALAVICDDYFVPALEHICEDLGLQADVAGATFMAAGSSAPEFMTSVVGVFFAESDVGVGTIVGSAVFNILFIIGVCGVFAGMVIELTWYPLVRDTLYYLLSVLTLFLIIMDQHVNWYEALIMVLLYCFYIILMYFNRTLEANSRAWVRGLLSRFGRQPLVEKPPDNVIPDEMKRARAHRKVNVVESIAMTRRGYKSFENEEDG